MDAEDESLLESKAQAQVHVPEQGQHCWCITEHSGMEPKTKRKRSALDRREDAKATSAHQSESKLLPEPDLHMNSTPLQVFEGLTTRSSLSSSSSSSLRSSSKKKQKKMINTTANAASPMAAPKMSTTTPTTNTSTSASGTGNAKRGSPVVPMKRPRGRPRILDLPRMNNSERGKFYRRKKQMYVDGLQTQVTSLRHVVDDLNTWCRLRRAGPSKSTLIQIVREFFRQFRSGMQLPVGSSSALPGPPRSADSESGVSVSTESESVSQSVSLSAELTGQNQTLNESQKLFVELMLTKDVRIGHHHHGSELLVEQLRLFSSAYEHVQAELSFVTTIEHDGNQQEPAHHARVCARGRLLLSVGEQTLTTLFGASALTDSQLQLAQMLVHKELQIPFQSWFVFAQDGRIRAIECQFEYMLALLTMVKHDVLKIHELLQMAHMTRHFSSSNSSSPKTMAIPEEEAQSNGLIRHVHGRTHDVTSFDATQIREAVDATSGTSTPPSRMDMDYLLS